MGGKGGEGGSGDLEKKVADGLVPAPGSHHECSETTVCAEGGVRPRLKEEIHHRVMAHIGGIHQWGPASCVCECEEGVCECECVCVCVCVCACVHVCVCERERGGKIVV